MHNCFQTNKLSTDNEYSIIYVKADTLVGAGGTITPNITRWSIIFFPLWVVSYFPWMKLTQKEKKHIVQSLTHFVSYNW